MKKIVRWIGISFVLLLVLISYGKQTFANEEQPLLQIPILSDTHIGMPNDITRLTKALQDYSVLAPNYDAMAIVGDFTDTGSLAQYGQFRDLLASFSNPQAEKVIAMGNHEFFEPRYTNIPDATEEMYIDRFIQETGMPSLYYMKEIKGYPFIVLGSEQSQISNPGLGDRVVISDTQYTWLEDTLNTLTDPNKPIFLFLHQPIDFTVYGSEHWGAGFEDERLLTILQKHPQVILFTGHSHYLLEHPRSVYQDGFTMVNTGSIQSPYYPIGGVPFRSQGLLVNVYEDQVVIKGRDFNKDEWVNEFTVPIPFEEDPEKDTSPPSFSPDTKVDYLQITDESVTFTFDPAIDDTLVDRYVVYQDDQAIYTHYPKYWENERETKETITISNLIADQNYQYSVVAYDAWNHSSETQLQIEFKSPSSIGWVFKNDHWYYLDSSGNAKKGWLQLTNNWYYLNSLTGEMTVGWLNIDGQLHYFDSQGVMVTGWLQENGKWYYMDHSGSLVHGWVYDQGSYYYIGEQGMLQHTWVKDNGEYYYLDHSGKMQTGWLLSNSTWYYLHPNGSRASGWVKNQQSWYFMNGEGVMQTGWIQTDGQWYFLSPSGSMQTGWIQSGGKWYFLSPSGSMQTGWIQADGKWYFLSSSGSMQTGWIQSGGQWYFLSSSGSMQTGWIQADGKWYLLSSSGSMQTGWIQSGGQWYFLSSSGSMQTGWIQSEGDWYLLSSSGSMQTGWIQSKGDWYYLAGSGKMATGTINIGGTNYTFDRSGKLI
ncbi:metallophosphoesterase [Cytobacillus gottheilii]|uniref:metallophosphoesterase n=1 Tax=Cytobacillus gottheilii TaxID=859144 RepID=UPI001592EDD8|nr:metallophosphoesterase [Cytobacillus gottheilii]